MSAYVYGGSIITMQLGSVTTLTQSPDDVVRAVSSAIQASGLTVTNYTVQTGSTTSYLLGITMGNVNQPFTVTMSVQTPDDLDYSDDTDVLSIVASAFYQATGQMPSPQVDLSMVDEDGNVTQLGTAISTQAPGNQQSGNQVLPAGVNDLVSGISNSLGNLGKTLSTVTALIPLLIIGIILLLIFSPEARKTGVRLAGA